MKGTDKQTEYAKAILTAIDGWSRETLAAAVMDGDIPQYYAKIEAQRIAAETAVLAAIEAGDTATAETLFAAVERADLVAGFLDGTEINAGRFIDTYKALYYKVTR